MKLYRDALGPKKPKRQPDHIGSRAIYWFEEMVAICDVHTSPFSISRMVVDLKVHSDVMILITPDAKSMIPHQPSEMEYRAYKMWEKQKAEEILLGIKT